MKFHTKTLNNKSKISIETKGIISNEKIVLKRFTIALKPKQKNICTKTQLKKKVNDCTKTQAKKKSTFALKPACLKKPLFVSGSGAGGLRISLF